MRVNIRNWVLALSAVISVDALAIETSIKGIVDLRAYYVDSNDANSYLAGDYGKFRYDDGSGLALGQLGAQLHLDWQSNWSATLVANAFANKGNEEIGITEAFISYKGLPSTDGWRVKSKIGVFYPAISLENVATAWSTPYTLTSSSLNNWIGEELRNTGINVSVEKLGKFANSKHTFSLGLSLFQNNDPAGAMLAWHGWTIGSRQTLLHEKLIVQDFPARQTKLSAQAAESDPFKELDNRWGLDLKGTWKYTNKVKFSLGYYDNHAEKGLVENGQYTWTTRFTHLGLKYRFAKEWELIGQYMIGSTDMYSPFGEPVVDNDYDNGFILLRHFWQNHHLAVRAEHFSVTDKDTLWGDNNNEDGNALTFSYRYKINKNNYLLSEVNWVESTRPSRWYLKHAVEQTERQFQLGYRYYF